MTGQSKFKVFEKQSVPEFVGATRATRAAQLILRRAVKSTTRSGQAIYSLVGRRKRKVCRLNKLTSFESILHEQIQSEPSAIPFDITSFSSELQKIAPEFVEKILGVSQDWMNPLLYSQLGVGLLSVIIGLIQLFRHRDSGFDITINIISLGLNITQLVMVTAILSGIDIVKTELKNQVNNLLNNFLSEDNDNKLTTKDTIKNIKDSNKQVELVNTVNIPKVDIPDLPKLYSEVASCSKTTHITTDDYLNNAGMVEVYKFPVEFYEWMEQDIEKHGKTTAMDKVKTATREIDKFIGKTIDVTNGSRGFSGHINTLYRTYNLVATSGMKNMKTKHNMLLEVIYQGFTLLDLNYDETNRITFTQRAAKRHDFFQEFISLTPVLMTMKIQKREEVQAMPSVDTMVKMACGLVASIIAVCDFAKGGSFGKKIVMANSVKKAISENVTDVREIVEAISYDVFGYNMSADSYMILEVEKIREEVEQYLMRDNPYYVSHQPEFYKFKECLKRAKSILTSHQGRSNQLKSSLANSFKLLDSVVSRAQIIIEKVATAIFSMATRQETLPILISGLHGAGKTQFTTTWLIPQIQERMSYSKYVYTINFGENHHWPIYNGAEVGVYDEFLARKSSDPIIPEINALCSSGSYNMPAAAVEYKMQPCRLKLLALIANQFHIPLGDTLTASAAHAFYSRFANFAFILKSQDVTKALEGKLARTDIQHAKNFEDELLEIRYYLRPPGQEKVSYAPTPRNIDTLKLPAPYKIITKHEMLDIICDMLQKKDDENQARIELINNDVVQGESDNLVYMFLGEPGSGKSRSAISIANTLSNITKLPIIEIHADTVLSNVILDEPHIIVTHDAIYNELNFNGFYDRIPKPSIILNTANLKIKFMRPITSEQQIEEMSLIERGINWVQSLSRSSIGIESKLLVNPAPGWIRRTGIPGVLQHRNNESYRPNSTGGLYSFKAYKKYAWDGSKFNSSTISDSDISQEIFIKYNQIVKDNNELEMQEVTEFSINQSEYDCVVAAKTSKELSDMVNDPKKCIEAYFRGRNSGTLPVVKISQRLFASKFKFNPTQFRMKDLGSSVTKEQLLEMAKTSFAFLKLSNREHTCQVTSGEFEARCKDNLIEYRLQNNLESQLYIEKIGENVVITRVDVDGNLSREGEYNLLDVCRGMETGFQHTKVLNTEHVKVLMEQIEGLSQDPSVAAMRDSTKLKMVNAGHILEQASMFTEAWNTFKKSKLYTLICVVLCVIGSSVLLTLLINIVSFFTRRNDPEVVLVDGLPTEIIFEETVCRLEWTRKNNKRFDVMVDPGDLKDVDTEQLHNMLKLLVEHKIKDGRVDNIGIFYKQSDPDEDEMSKKGGRRVKSSKLKDKNSRFIAQNWEPQSSGTNQGVGEQFATITAQLDRNMCRVQTDVSGVFGLLIKENIVLTTPHVYTNATRINVEKYGKSWEAKVIYTDPSNEVGLLQILDTKFPNARDITSKFIQHSHLGYVYQTQLRVPNRTMTSFTNTCATSDIIRLNVPVKISGIVTQQHWYSMMAQTHGPVTSLGDCGSLLLAATNQVGPGIIIGQHYSLAGSVHTRASVVTREYIDNILNLAKRVVYTKIQDEPQVEELDKVLRLSCRSEFFDNVVIDRVMDEDTGLWFEELEDLELYDDEDIFYDAEGDNGNPNNHMLPIGFDRKCSPSWRMKNNIKPTPWQAQIIDKFPLMKCPAPLRVCEVPDTSNLIKANGSKSILFTQLNKMNKCLEWDKQQLTHLNSAIDWLSSEYRSIYNLEHRPLTTLENINGLVINPRESEIYTQLEGLELDSSGGYLMQTLFKQTDKHKLFSEKFCMPNGKIIYDWADSSLAQRVKLRTIKMEELAREGIRMVLPVRDSLKVETIKLSKHQVGATRVFQASDISEVMLFRKYTGTMQAIMKAKRHLGHCQVGVDPFVGFTTIYQRFLKTGTQGESGDFVNWDKPLRAKLICAAFEVWKDTMLMNWKGPKVELENVFKVMQDCLVHTLAVADGVVYFTNLGMPSGTSVTACLNSTCNDLLRYMCLSYLVQRHNIAYKAYDTERFKEWCKTEYGEFTPIMNNPIIIDELFISQNVDHVSYGDDIFSVVAKEYAWIFNFEKLKMAYAYFGVTYDTANKDGSTYRVVDLDKLSFMSREFKLLGKTNMIIPPLKKSSVIGHLHWTRNDTIAQYTQNIQSCLNEARYHDKDFYDSIVETIQRICLQIPQLRCLIPKYDRQQVTISEIAYLGRGVIQGDFIEKSPKRQDEKQYESFEYQSSSERSNECIKMLPEIHIEEVDCFMKQLRFINAKILKKYVSSPAYVEIPLARKKYYSIVFDAIRFDTDAVTSVISDLTLALSNSMSNSLIVKPLVYTVCLRKLSNGEHWCWQIQCDIQRRASQENTSRKSTTEGVTFSKGWEIKQTDEIQATGTEETPMFNGSNDTVIADAAFQEHTVANKIITLGLYDKDIAELKSTSMQVQVIPVAMGTAMSTVIKQITYGNRSDYHPAMYKWSKMHSRINGPEYHLFEIVAPSTVVEQFLIGITMEVKSAYEPWELQLIEWKAEAATQGVWRTFIDLASVTGTIPAWTDFIDSAPVGTKRPTIVIMTRVPIQNSYANDGVSVQIIHQAYFGKNTKFVTLPSDLLPEPENFRAETSLVSLSKALGLHGPLYISTDGDVIGNSVRGSSTMGTLPSKMTLSRHSLIYPTASTDDMFSSHTISHGKVTSYTDWNYAIGEWTAKVITPPESLKQISEYFGFQEKQIDVPTTDPDKMYVWINPSGIITTENTVMPYRRFEEFIEWTKMKVKQNNPDVSDVIVYEVPNPTELNFKQIKNNAANTYQGVDQMMGYVYRLKNDIETVFRVPSRVLILVWEIKGMGIDYTYAFEFASAADCISGIHSLYAAPISNDTTKQRLSVVGMVNPNIKLANISINEMQLLTLDSAEVEKDILAPGFVNVKFSQMVPPSVPDAMAGGGRTTIFNDPSFLAAWDNYCVNTLGLDISETWYVTFKLQSTTSPTTIASVIYSTETKLFQLKDNHGPAIHGYKVYPKTAFSDALLTDVQVSPTMRGIASTNTSGWADRVYRIGDEHFFDGRTMIDERTRAIRLAKKLEIFEELKITNEVQAMVAGMVGGGLLQGLGQGIGAAAQASKDLKMQKNSLDAQMAMLEKSLANASGMQKEQLEAQRSNLEFQLSQNFINQSRLQEYAHENNLDLREVDFQNAQIMNHLNQENTEKTLGIKNKQEEDMIRLKAQLNGISTSSASRYAGVGYPERTDNSSPNTVGGHSSNFVYGGTYTPTPKDAKAFYNGKLPPKIDSFVGESDASNGKTYEAVNTAMQRPFGRSMQSLALSPKPAFKI